MKAIDISLYQTVYDWDAVLRDGVRFCVIKASQGRYLDGSGAPFRDPSLAKHARGAIDAGLPIGFYHFLGAGNEAEAVAEAQFFLDAIAPFRDAALYAFLDCENYGNRPLLSQNRAELTATCLAFLRHVERGGIRAGLYSNPDHLAHYLDASKLRYPLWVAAYGTSRPSYERMVLWQYGVGRVNGISGDADLGESYISESELAVMRLYGLRYLRAPAYWREQFPQIPHLDTLLIRCAAAFKRAGQPCESGHAGIARLTEGGFLKNPAYWEKELTRHRWLEQLFRNLGGYCL